jgi:TPR repeat protein/archaellum component FlaC
MAARRRRWPDEDDGGIERSSSRRRRSIGEWLEDEIESPQPRRARARHDSEDERFEAITSAISMLEERLEGATQGSDASRSRRKRLGNDHDLGDVIAQITNQQDALDYQYEGQNLENVQRLQNQVRELRSVVEAATHGSSYPGLTNDIYDLQQRLNPHLISQGQAFSGMGDPMQRSFNSSLGQQMQALGQRHGFPQPGGPAYLPVPVAGSTSLTSIEGLRRDVQTLRNSIRHSSEGRTLQGLEAEIRSLNRKLNEGGVSNAARDIQDIKTRMDHLNRVIQESGVNSKNSYLTAQLQHINENIARVQRPVLPDRLVEDVRRELADATRKLVPLSVHDARTLEKNIQFLAERLDSLRARQPDNARLQSLEEHLGRLTSQLNQSGVFSSLERMEKTLQELHGRITQAEGPSSVLDGKAMSVLRGFQKQIEDVKAAADASDKRMYQTLHTLQDVIVKVAEKGNAPVKTENTDKSESAFGQRGGLKSKSATSAAHEAAAKAAQAQEDLQTQELPESDEEEATQRLGQSFHAKTSGKQAVRKQIEQALRADARGRPSHNFNSLEDNDNNVRPFRRTKRYATQFALAGVGIALVIGIYNILGPILNGEQTATASISHAAGEFANATGLNFTAPRREEGSARNAMQVAAIDSTISPQKLSLTLPSFPAAITNPRLRTAVQNGDVRAFYEIGSRLINGRDGVSRDIGLGLEWLQLAADKQHAPSLYRIGGMYSKGLGVKRDLHLAETNLTAAAELGNRMAMHDLGTLYASGMNGEPELGKAFPWFKRAAELNLIDSQYNLAIFYVNGFSVKQDLVEAYKWFAIAAQNGDAESIKKRDEIGSRFDGKTLVKAKLAAQSFKPQALDPAANEDVIPASAWGEEAPATADLSNIKPVKGGGNTGLSINVPQEQAAAKAR